jgi:hypothetical protein
MKEFRHESLNSTHNNGAESKPVQQVRLQEMVPE